MLLYIHQTASMHVNVDIHRHMAIWESCGMVKLLSNGPAHSSGHHAYPELVILLHARRCANHATHGRFNPLSQQIIIYVRTY